MTEKYKKLYKNRGIAMGISLAGTWKVILTDASAGNFGRERHRSQRRRSESMALGCGAG